MPNDPTRVEIIIALSPQLKTRRPAKSAALVPSPPLTAAIIAGNPNEYKPPAVFG